MQAAWGAWSVDPSLSKYTVIVDEDIDVRSEFEALWAMCWRTEPQRDVQIVRETPPTPLDPSTAPPDMPRAPAPRHALVEGPRRRHAQARVPAECHPAPRAPAPRGRALGRLRAEPARLSDVAVPPRPGASRRRRQAGHSGDGNCGRGGACRHGGGGALPVKPHALLSRYDLCGGPKLEQPMASVETPSRQSAQRAVA